MKTEKLLPLISVLRNLILIYICYFVCRVEFLLENYSLYSDNMDFDLLMSVFGGGLRFDTSAILYTNSLYILLVLLPSRFKFHQVYRKVVKYLFLIVNSIAIAVNLGDSVYFQFTGRRTTMSFFQEFSNESNLLGIFFTEVVNHWYLFILGIALLYGLFRLYKDYDVEHPFQDRKYFSYYLSQLIILVPAFWLVIAGMRGGFTRETRPITLSNANQYVNRPLETAIVLNTPFTLIRSVGKKVFTVPAYYTDRNEMQSYYTPLHQPSDSLEFRPMNVVILIMESFGSEYIGALNRNDSSYGTGYTNFLDSLISRSLVFEHSFANGKKSIDALPSVLSGIPMFVEPFFLSEASLNSLTSVGGLLSGKGYYTAFYHGAGRGSMGFMAYSKACGYKDYFGREDYGNNDDFDGHWAIWDEEYLQYFADELDKKPQPFSVGFFSASSHHPFSIPDRYKDIFPEEGGHGIYKTIRYTDNALRQFFNKASKMDWFKNTLFVITGDHTNHSSLPQYLTEAGTFKVPVIFYQPSDSALVGVRKGISQQIDIMPSVLGYLNYDEPYVSFGCDLFSTKPEDTFAVNYINGIYQYFRNDYMLQFDGVNSVALYDYVSDPLLSENLLDKRKDVANEMEMYLKSVIQQYMERMVNDQLVLDKEK